MRIRCGERTPTFAGSAIPSHCTWLAICIAPRAHRFRCSMEWRGAATGMEGRWSQKGYAHIPAGLSPSGLGPSELTHDGIEGPQRGRVFN